MAALDRMSLYPFQKEGIAIATNREASLIADDMGLGKTVQAIGVINEDASIRRVLVVCPASVRIPWQRELDQRLNRSFTIAVVGVNWLSYMCACSASACGRTLNAMPIPGCYKASRISKPLLHLCSSRPSRVYSLLTDESRVATWTLGVNPSRPIRQSQFLTATRTLDLHSEAGTIPDRP